MGAAIGAVRRAVRGPGAVRRATELHIINSMLFLCAVCSAGRETAGVIFGAFIIVYLPNRLLGVHFLASTWADLKYLFFGLALVVMMISGRGLFPAASNCWHGKLHVIC